MPQKNQFSYIFVSGGVLSGVGKGAVTASLALLLKSRGYRVTVVKCENYLNIDSGLINPIEHGDSFLCQDGTETDMDIGTYEKFLDQDLGKLNFITMGQIYKAVIDRERNFGYQGEDVEAIPHVTDEIIFRINQAGEADQAQIVVVELGGTTGEYQNSLYYEAARILQYVKHMPVVHVHVSYLPTPPHLGEPKTKPTQLSVKLLNGMGIHPDFIVARAIKPIDHRRRSRFSLFCSVPADHIIDSPDVPNIYQLPLLFSKQHFDQKVIQCLGLKLKPQRLEAWEHYLQELDVPTSGKVTLAVVGKYFETGEYELKDSYAALYDALNHAAVFHHLELTIIGLNSAMPNLDKKLYQVDGIIVPIGWGERGVEGKIEAIQFARTQKIPFLGLCYGMQLAVVEYARHVAKLPKAHTTEVDPQSPDPVIHMIPEQKRILENRAYGGTMRLGSWECYLQKDSLVYSCYSKHHQFDREAEQVISERHRHRYEFNDAYAAKLESLGLVISGRSVKENLVEMIELPQTVHPFFVGTQGHPEYKSRPLRPHALFIEFLRAAFLKKQG